MASAANLTLASLHSAALEKFQEAIAEHVPPWSGSSPRGWANAIQPGLGDSLNLPSGNLTRDQLFSLWTTAPSVESAFLATMAWGGMKRGHGRLIWQHRPAWAPICESLANGEFTPGAAYEAFRLKRADSQLPGMGPAYFTKLIFFATGAHAKATGNAFILDQWTARSVHCLTNQFDWPRVSLDYATKKRFARTLDPRSVRVTVSDRVSASDYQNYCGFVERLAKRLGIDPPHFLEEKMFGIGGRSPSVWRRFLMQSGGHYLKN